MFHQLNMKQTTVLTETSQVNWPDLNKLDSDKLGVI